MRLEADRRQCWTTAYFARITPPWQITLLE
jgi:hypothetical protein